MIFCGIGRKSFSMWNFSKVVVFCRKSKKSDITNRNWLGLKPSYYVGEKPLKRKQRTEGTDSDFEILTYISLEKSLSEMNLGKTA